MGIDHIPLPLARGLTLKGKRATMKATSNTTIAPAGGMFTALMLFAIVLGATPLDASVAVRGAPSGTAAKRNTTAPQQTQPPAPRARADSSMTLRGGEEGTVFRSLTIEGEDRIHFEVERPVLHLELDPEKAPGLDWGSAREVLDRTSPDLISPFLAMSTRGLSPYVAHPWLSHFASGVVAIFRPDVKGVERWKLSVANARGEAVVAFEGRGDPPREIAWNGLSANGAPVLPGLTYSYVFEASDRAGNKRNFVGEGFGVSAWRLETPTGPSLSFSGSELRTTSGGAAARLAAMDGAPAVVIEAASWLNQSARPTQLLRLEATARSVDEADLLAGRVSRWLGPLLIGGVARMQVATEVRADAPESGAVRITAAR